MGNIIAGVSNNLTQLVAGRLISGVGGAGLLSLCVIIISRQYNMYQNMTPFLTEISRADL